MCGDGNAHVSRIVDQELGALKFVCDGAVRGEARGEYHARPHQAAALLFPELALG